MPPQNSFEVLPDLSRRMLRIDPRWRWFWKAAFAVFAILRRLRVSRPVTRLLGRQYRRSRDLIEIDITYLCNLHCLNCNRSVSQAREALHMPLSMVAGFVNESIKRGKRWRRVRVLGGEPTLHPQFAKVVEELLRYKRWHPDCIVEVVTNGYGPEVNRALAALPPDVMIDNSQKTTPIQPTFGPFNLAPLDDHKYRNADFSNGCAVLRDCGMGLTPLGYYPCAVAGGIDRILGARLGVDQIPNDGDDMVEAAAKLCGLCGRFRDGHFVPKLLRPELRAQRTSPTWAKLYKSWHERRRAAVEAPTAAPGPVSPS